MKDIVDKLSAWAEITKEAKIHKNAFDYLYLFCDKLSEDIEDAIKEIELYRDICEDEEQVREDGTPYHYDDFDRPEQQHDETEDTYDDFLPDGPID